MLVKKNILIMHPTDNGACSFYRCRFMAMILQSQLAGEVEVIVSPAEINDDYILAHTAAIIVYRPYTDEHVTLIRNYGRKKNKLKYRIFADYDDVIWNVGGKSLIPDYNGSGIDTDMATINIKQFLQYLDGVTVSTEFLATLFRMEFRGLCCTVLPNAVPRYVFGQERRKPIEKDIEKPVVLYGGSSTHYKNGSTGDFNDVWIDYLFDAVLKDKIELHMFDVPWFLEQVKDKIVLHYSVSALEYPSIVASIKPDIYLGPLAINEFNMAKSNLKMLEASALGAAFLGSCFKGSPYYNAPTARLTYNAVVPSILNNGVEEICKKHVFNDTIEEQYERMEQQHLWMDSLPYIHRFLRTYFGNDIKANF